MMISFRRIGNGSKLLLQKVDNYRSIIDFAARSHGRYDFIATLVGASATHLLDVIDEIRSLPSVSTVDTWTHLDILKEDYARTLGRVLPQA